MRRISRTVIRRPKLSHFGQTCCGSSPLASECLDDRASSNCTVCHPNGELNGSVGVKRWSQMSPILANICRKQIRGCALFDLIPRKKQKGQSEIGLNACLAGAPGAIRTPDPLVRSQVLYPAELRAHTRGANYTDCGQKC